MAKFSFSDIEDAFLFVSSNYYGENSAVLCKDTGEILYCSSASGIDEIGDIDELDWDRCVEMPHKNDFNLGKALVFEFAEKHLPDDYALVRQMFRHGGAYSLYKTLLERHDLLQQWYEFENSRQEQALRNWCQEKDIELDGQP